MGEAAAHHAGEGEAGASDEELARRIQSGERDALERLVRRYVRPVHAIAAAFLLDDTDAEDVAQETFLRVLRAIGGYDANRPFAPWLYQIARNCARNHRTSRLRRHDDALSHELRSSEPGPDVAAERAALRTRVDAAIARLPEQRRTAFYLTDVEGYPTNDVARIMNLSPGTVRSHVHHARAALRVALADLAERVEKEGE